MRRILKSLLVILLFAMYGNADDIDLEVHSGLMLKMLRDMANKTNASESLNLPANASSIRENITDTFSCENRTYGYYADVDNECQIFHVCLPSQTPSGRNVTYRWSFICPNETIFNQEVLTCTRPHDSIPCEDSPDYYDLNKEIGKVPPKNDTKKTNEKDTRYFYKPQVNERERYNDKDRNHLDNDRERYNDREKNHQEKERNQNQLERERERNDRNQIQKRRQDNRKQNIVIDKFFTEVVDEEMKEKLQDLDKEFGDNVEEIFPEIITDEVIDNEPKDVENTEQIAMTDEEIEGRLALERNVGERRSFRFKADV